jgi:tRNA-splicing ligase RtcB
MLHELAPTRSAVDAGGGQNVRRALINAIVERTPTGAGKGQRSVKKSRHVTAELGRPCRD